MSAGLIDEIGGYAVQSGGAFIHSVRRRVIAILADRTHVRRERLAEALAADDSVPEDDPDRIEVALHHNHLPRLDDAQLVEYDRRTGDVALFCDADTALELLEDTR